MVTIELEPGGANIPATEENKEDYVNAIVEYRISERVGGQFEALMTAFSKLIPWDLLNIFDERELELLINGTSEIDVYATYPSLPLVYSRADRPYLLVTTGVNSQTTEDMRQRTKSSSGSGGASEAGRRNANPACSRSQPGPPESLPAGSGIYQVLMVLADSPSRSQAIPHNSQ